MYFPKSAELEPWSGGLPATKSALIAGARTGCGKQAPAGDKRAVSGSKNGSF